MKYLTFFFISFITLNSLSAQAISISKDSLEFGLQRATIIGADEIWEYDSLLITNGGDSTLQIDFFLSETGILYNGVTIIKDSTLLFEVFVEKFLDSLYLKIEPAETLIAYFWYPDLCPFCKTKDRAYFEDWIYILSNANNLDTAKIFAYGEGFPSAIGDDQNLLNPNRFTLNQNYPNPFNPVTTISFSLPKPSKIQLTIYNIKGERIESLIDRQLSIGYHDVKFIGSSLSSGIYFYRVESEFGSFVKKMVLIK